MRKLWGAIAVGGFLLSLSATAGHGSSTPVGGPATALTAWNEYCLASPDDCRIDSRQPTTIPYTRRLMRLLATVNATVNGRIIQQPDPEHRGVVDRWEIPSDGIGDCEDLQLMKRQMLIKAGLPRRALLMTVVVTPQGEGHAVLTVRTSDGDYILDNQNKEVRRWDRTKLWFVKRESQDATAWVSVGTPSISPVTAAQAP